MFSVAPLEGDGAIPGGKLDQIRIGLEVKLLHHAVFVERHRALPSCPSN